MFFLHYKFSGLRFSVPRTKASGNSTTIWKQDPRRTTTGTVTMGCARLVDVGGLRRSPGRAAMRSATMSFCDTVQAKARALLAGELGSRNWEARLNEQNSSC
mmetsp:Transcript_68441/g.182576  ORF Transcript_68441/g.182576 Transcript_68441/m.182576 type:complete len:102 (+) Transcript_68441:197-502(+)